MNEIRFEVVYTPLQINGMQDMMLKLDVGIEEFIAPASTSYAVRTVTEVTPAYIQHMREGIREFFEGVGCEVQKIILC